MKRRGFTLIECLAVVTILAIIATLGVVRLSRTLEDAKVTAAWSDLKCLRDAFVDPAAGYLRDMRGIPGFSVGYLRLANLFMATNLYGAVCDGDVATTGVRVDAARTGRLARGACADADAFVRWDPDAGRGWRGPYVRHIGGAFPGRATRRFADDATAEERGFFPPLLGLREPDDFLNRLNGCSVYGFPDEPAMIDPWGNPYVLQIPPAQAFAGANTNLPDNVRFRFARLVSAGPDGRLDTPCFAENPTNWWMTAWGSLRRRRARQAGRANGDVSSRGDDLVLFLMREDTDEGDDE